MQVFFVKNTTLFYLTTPRLQSSIYPIGVETLYPKRQSAPVRQAVFLYPNFTDLFSLPLKIDLENSMSRGRRIQYPKGE